MSIAPKKGTTLSRPLKVLILATCVAVVVFQGLWIWSQREQTLEQAEVATLNLARSLDQHAEDTFEMAGLALSSLIDALNSTQRSPDLAATLHTIMANQVAAAPRLRGLFVYDTEGRWLASSLPTMPANANNSDRSYFRHHRSNDRRGIFIGPPLRSRSGGQWIITLTRRFNNPDGSFGGVVLASIDVAYFADFYRGFDVGKEGSIVLLNSEGILYSRTPYLDGLVGMSQAGTPMFRTYLPNAPFGAYRFTSRIDGTRRVSGYKLGNRFPFVVIAAVGENEVLAPWRRAFVFRAGTVVVFAALLGFLGFRLAGQIERRQQAEAALDHMAHTDALTGLANRRAFDTALETEWARAGRDGTTLSLILLDVDHFKLFNDLYGHQAGDLTLQTVARECQRVARRVSDVAARYGGEELALILPNTDSAGALKVAELLRSGIESRALKHEDNPPWGVVTASIGCASLRSPRDNPSMKADAIISMADRALYEAKLQGRNRIVGSGPLMSVSKIRS